MAILTKGKKMSVKEAIAVDLIATKMVITTVFLVARSIITIDAQITVEQ